MHELYVAQDNDYFERSKIPSTDQALSKMAEMARMGKPFRIVSTKINYKRWEESNELFKTSYSDLWAQLTPKQQEYFGSDSYQRGYFPEGNPIPQEFRVFYYDFTPAESK